MSGPNESKKSQSKSCLKLVTLFWISEEPPILPDEVHSQDFINFSKSFSMKARSLKFLMNHETKELSQELSENSFLNSSFTSSNNFATKLTMHKTQGRAVQAVDKSYI